MKTNQTKKKLKNPEKKSGKKEKNSGKKKKKEKLIWGKKIIKHFWVLIFHAEKSKSNILGMKNHEKSFTSVTYFVEIRLVF